MVKKLMSLLMTAVMGLGVLPVISAVGADSTPTLTVDMTAEDHDIIHGAAGFLYGISNEGVPDVNTLTPLKPKVLATKGALGTEHPYGDALDVADEFFEAGGSQVQMYNSNYYGVFGVTADAYEYGKVLKEIIAPKVASWKDEMREKYPDIDSRMVYIPINEGTPRNYNGGEATIMNSWKVYYDSIKSADPNAVIAGPNNAAYGDRYGNMREFLTFCRNNNCLPDVVTWHELQVGCLNTMSSHIADYRNICRDLGIEEKQVVINEYADYADCGVPGRLVNWIARLEDNQVYGCLPFWHQANNLNDLAANQNQGNGAWQLYNWYGNMSGRTLNVSASNTTFDKLYGLASIDSTKKSADVLFGGSDGTIKVRLNNIPETETFRDANKVHIKVEAAYYSGYHGAVNDTDTILDGTYAVENGCVEIELKDCKFSTAYRINVTEASEEENIVPVKGAYRAEYEAENAFFYGNVNVDYQHSAYPPYYYCGGQRVGGFNAEGDGIEYSIYVPFDGKYKLEFIYGNGVGETRNNMNTHKPLNLTHKLTVDRAETYDLELPNTLFYAMEGKVDKYLDLTKGNHRIKLEFGDLAGGYHDALYVTHVGAYEKEAPLYTKTFEAEAADFNLFSGSTPVLTETEIQGYSAGGYVTGLNELSVEEGGGIRWITSVEESGLYNLNFRFNVEESGEIRVFKDNTNLTYTNLLTAIPFEAKDGWQNANATVYFKKGINIIDIDTTAAAAMDKMTLKELKNSASYSVKYEAEAAEGAFETAVSKDNKTYVLPLLGSENARNTEGQYIELSVFAENEGEYRMQVFQSNNDLCGTHSYNIKIIDRYMSVEVNSEDANMYFFPNSFSDDSFIETTIPLKLKAGENKIRIYNDNSKTTLWGGTTSTPGENVLVNYTPNLESFVLWPAVVESDIETEYKITVSSTNGGYAYVNSNAVREGENAVLTVVPEGNILSVTVNGKEVKDNLLSNGLEFTYEITDIQDDVTVNIVFSEATKLPEGETVIDGTLNCNGVTYAVVSDNLFPNSDFSDPSGENMNVWYRGTNSNGHNGVNGAIPNPTTGENLAPINDLLLTGEYEPAKQNNTFYFGKDNSSKYLVENIINSPNPWLKCAWNGEYSLMAFVPVKPKTKYFFSYRAYTAAGSASVRYGAVDTNPESENFFAPKNYSENEGLNFSGSGFMNCNNGGVQNVGGSWKTYETVIETGETADNFMFNAYWLQMCDYLCLGDFKLIELADAETEVLEVVSPEAVEIEVNGKLNLPEALVGITENGKVEMEVQWYNTDMIDLSTAGVYIVSGRVIFPEGHYGLSNVGKVKIRVIVLDNKPQGIYNEAVKGNELSFDIIGDKGKVYIAYYKGNQLLKAESEEGKTGFVQKTIPEDCDEIGIFLWDGLNPVCKSIKIREE